MRISLLGLVLACMLSAGQASAQGAGPSWNRVYGVGASGLAEVPVPLGPGLHWRVESLDGSQVVRDFAPADASGSVRVPPGGWYRLVQRNAEGAMQQVGHRFAAGYLVVVTGQSQADAFFFHGQPESGAFRAEAGDPPAPAVHAVVYECAGQPGCAPDGTIWAEAGENLGARLLIEELSRRLGGAPVALAAAAWGGATAQQLADGRTGAGQRLRRVARAVAPASAALILAHGSTDAFLGTEAAVYRANMALVIQVLRAAGGPAMVLAQAPLGPLDGRLRLLGSTQLAAWLAPAGRDALLARLGLAQAGPLGGNAVTQAATIRDAQALLAREAGLAYGGDLSRVALGPDGVHWSRDGVRHAAHQVAEALAAALRQ